jgi:transcriptional regulator with XRE-family HTH domain
MNIEEIGKNIKIYRLYNKFTQQELANKLFVSQVAVQQWETGKKMPQIDKLLDLANIFNIKVDQLYYNDTELRYYISDFEGFTLEEKVLRHNIIEKKKNKQLLNQIEQTYCKLHIYVKYSLSEYFNKIKEDLYKRNKVVLDDPFITIEQFYPGLPITEYDLYRIKQLKLVKNNQKMIDMIKYRHIRFKNEPIPYYYHL